MNEHAYMRKNDAGLTLIEIMIAVVVMTGGILALMSSIINLANQNRANDARLIAAHFTDGVLQSMDGLSIEDILTFNENGEVFKIDEGIVSLYGAGDATVTVSIVLSGVDGGVDERINLPVSAETAELFAAALPDPVEISVRVSMRSGLGEGQNLNFQSSKLVFYQ